MSSVSPTPTVTIMIPLYNGIEYLNQCISSIENQSYVFWKVLIGINGHPLNSDIYKQAKLFESDKITVKEYITKGKPDTMNAMLNDVSTDLICILDVDDWWSPIKLYEQMKIWKTGLWDIVGTQCSYIIREKISGSPNIPTGYIKDFEKTNPIINSSVLMRKKDAKWTNNYYGLDDYELWLKLFHSGRTFFNIPAKLVFHRIRIDSAYNTRNHQFVQELKNQFYQNIS